MPELEHQQLFHNMWQLHLLCMHHHLYTSPNNHTTNSTKGGDVDVIAGEVEGEIQKDNMFLQRCRGFLQWLHLLQHLQLFQAFQQHQPIWRRLLTNLLSRTLQNCTTIGICVFRAVGMYLLGTTVKLATCRECTIKLVVLAKMRRHT
jgi:hypothetical protein